MFGQITMYYERVIKSGSFSLKVPFSLGLYHLAGGKGVYYNDLMYYSLNKLFNTGIGLHYYPFKQGFTKLFVGPSLEFGIYKDVKYNSEFYISSNYTFRKYVSLLFNTGVLFNITNNFNMSGSFGFGRNFDSRKETRALRPSLNIGYRF